MGDLIIDVEKLEGKRLAYRKKFVDKEGKDYWPVAFSHISFETCEREVTLYVSNPPSTTMKRVPVISVEISGKKILIERSSAAESLFNLDMSQRITGIRSVRFARFFLSAAKSLLNPNVPKGTAGITSLRPARIRHFDGGALYIQINRRKTLWNQSTVDIYCVPKVIRDLCYTTEPQ